MRGQVELNKSTLFHLSMITLLGMPVVAFVIINVFHDFTIYETLFTRTKVAPHLRIIGLPAGVLYGLITVLIGIFLVTRPNMREINDFFGKMIQDLNPGWLHIFFYSICAGVGEEILFRAAIQPLIGIWPTAIIFVLLHGYINFNHFSTSLYGVFLIFVSAGFGYLDIFFGIAAPITAHFMYDLVMFYQLKRTKVSTEVPAFLDEEEMEEDA